MKYLLIIVLVSLFAFTARAQQTSPSKAAQKAPALATPRPNPMAHEQAHEAIKGDTAKLKAAFKELYPEIRPAQSIKERTEMALKRMDRMFKMQGIDSAKAHDSVMAAINPNEDEVLLYNVYAENFTPEEIKTLATFFKTPAGKHYLEVEQRLAAGHQQSEQYIMRTINMVTAPMRKPTERKPGEMPGRPGMRPHPGMRPGQAPQAPAEPAPAPEPQH